MVGDWLIDGVNRMQILEKLGKRPRFKRIPLNGVSVPDIVAALNLSRRHLNPGARVILAAELMNMRARGAQKESPSRAEVARAADVGLRTAVSGRTIASRGSRRLKRAVIDGHMEAHAAAKVVTAAERKVGVDASDRALHAEQNRILFEAEQRARGKEEEGQGTRDARLGGWGDDRAASRSSPRSTRLRSPSSGSGTREEVRTPPAPAGGTGRSSPAGTGGR